MDRSFRLPTLYPILDAGVLRLARIDLAEFGRALRDEGVRFLQYRDKVSSDALVLEQARVLRSIFPIDDAVLILNDRVELCGAADFDGAHVGQDDLLPGLARGILGSGRFLGVSTHNPAQVAAAANAAVNYIAIGPVFGTQSKLNPDPVIGLQVIASARRLTDKPLVAIGGITLSNAQAVLDAGADSLALISALVPTRAAGIESRLGKLTGDFLASIG